MPYIDDVDPFHHAGHPYARQAYEPACTKETNKFVKFLAWFLGLTMIPGLSYFWANGLVWSFCSGRGGRIFPAACPQQLDPVTDEQAERYARHLSTHIDGGWTLDWVYDRDMRPRADRTADQEKAMFASDFAAIDHFERLSSVERVGNSNDFTVRVLPWVTPVAYGFADTDRYKFHRNKADEQTMTLHLTAGSPNIDDVWGSLPDLDKDETATHGTHDAPIFTFVKAGYYYEDANDKSASRRHGAKGQLAAICGWAPAKAIKDHAIVDTSKFMIRTYVGWVRYSQIAFTPDSHFSIEADWPKHLAFCATPQ